MDEYSDTPALDAGPLAAAQAAKDAVKVLDQTLVENGSRRCAFELAVSAVNPGAEHAIGRNRQGLKPRALVCNREELLFLPRIS
jgi:hypothetical protein